MFTKKSGFTLLELMIVIGIVGVLSVVLFRTYATVSQITFRLQSEKNVMGEVFSFSQILQNISEKSSIDYTKYTSLEATKGFVDTLYLTGEEGALALFTTGNCIDPNLGITGFSAEVSADPCILVLQREGMKDISLTQSTIVQLSRVKFKVIPRESNESVLQSENTEHVFLKLQHPGFWMFLTVYSPSFSSLEWTRRVVLPFQQFYSLK